MKILKWIGAGLGVVIIVLGTLYLLRTDPVYMISGKRLSGAERPYPPDWSSCNDHITIAVETRPEAPHSVTTTCVVHEDSLIIPANGGSTKQWTANVVRDPRVRIKIGEAVYRARAERTLDLMPEDFIAAMIAKWPEFSERMGEEPPENLWFFRVGPRDAALAADTAAAKVAGTYAITEQTPIGAMNAVVTINADGTGQVVGPMGENPFENAVISGGDISWSMTIDTPMGEMDVNWSGTVDGDAFSGAITSKTDEILFSGTRQGEAQE